MVMYFLGKYGYPLTSFSSASLLSVKKLFLFSGGWKCLSKTMDTKLCFFATWSLLTSEKL